MVPACLGSSQPSSKSCSSLSNCYGVSLGYFFVIPNGVHGMSLRIPSSSTFGSCQPTASTTVAASQLLALHERPREFGFLYVARPLGGLLECLHL
jgi:hypothetical protein